MYCITPSEMTCSGQQEQAHRELPRSLCAAALPRISELPAYAPLAAGQQYSPLTP